MRGRPLGSGKQLEERLLAAVREVKTDGATSAAVAKKYKVELNTLYHWCGKYRRDKKNGLKSRPARRAVSVSANWRG